MKLLADAALIGFPNAGKSTMISAVSAAKPKIADYPFTTLEPHLGVVRFHDHEFVLADIPGLIEGAAEGKGLGHQFLRHVERARVLVILIDLAPVDGRSAAEQERVLVDELRRYRPDLLDRPRMVVGSKADVATEPFDGMRVSAVTGAGLDEFLGAVAVLVDEAPRRGGRTRLLRRVAADRTRLLGRPRGDARVARTGAARGTGGGARRPHEPRGDVVRATATRAHGRGARARPGRRGRRRRRAHRRHRAHIRGSAHVSALAVVKVGTSSITRETGELDDAALIKLAGDLAHARGDGNRIVLVLSGAIAAGMPALGMARRPADMGTLQAIAAVGQPRLQERMNALLGTHGIVAGQVLLTPYDFVHRSQYLHRARRCSDCSTSACCRS